MKAAIYARVSTDAQSQNSTKDQIRECKNFLKRNDMELYEIYVDEAVSGSDVSRAEYTRLKLDAYANQFQCILVDDLSRLGRDMPEFITLIQNLRDIDVRLIGVSDGIDSDNPSSKIPFYFKGLMNELYLDDLTARIVRGSKG